MQHRHDVINRHYQPVNYTMVHPNAFPSRRTTQRPELPVCKEEGNCPMKQVSLLQMLVGR